MTLDIDAMARRYYGRSFGYYFLRTDWVPTLMLLMVIGLAVMLTVVLGWWWFWLIVLAINVPPYCRMVVASRRAWRSLQSLGDTLSRPRPWLN